MTEEERKIEEKIMPWRFRFFVVVSLLLILTFVYYLPTRFLYNAGAPRDDEMADDGHGQAHDEDLPSAGEILKLAPRTPGDRLRNDLEPLMKEGVKEFRLTADEFRWEYAPGKWVHVWGYNGQIPGPTIRVREGDKVRIIVKNNLPEGTSVHWHGLDVSFRMDGVPGLTQRAIKTGGEFVYEFAATPAGTRFYHTHGSNHTTSAKQLDMGLSGAFIVEPKNKTLAYDKESILLLDEWDIRANGANGAIGHMHGGDENMPTPHFNTFTINGRVFPFIEPIKIKQGERQLIRFINAGSAEFHPMHLHGHNFTVVARDGNLLTKAGQELRNTVTVHPGETLDILVEAVNPGAWMLHCHHVHHASAGMAMLFEYEGFAPVAPEEL